MVTALFYAWKRLRCGDALNVGPSAMEFNK